MQGAQSLQGFGRFSLNLQTFKLDMRRITYIEHNEIEGLVTEDTGWPPLSASSNDVVLLVDFHYDLGVADCGVMF